MWHPSDRKQTFTNFFHQHGSLLQTAISPSNKTLQHGLPSVSWTTLGAGPCSSMGSPTGCRRDSTPSLISKGCKMSDISLQAEGKWLLWCAYPAPFSLTSVSTWLFLSCPTPLQNKMNSQNKCNSSNGLFPFKYVITETLIGSALGRGGTDLKPEMLLKGTYKEACQQPPLPLPNPTRHKPDPQLPDQMFWEFIVARKRSSKDYNISLYSTVKTCKRKRHHSTSTSAF